MTVEYIELKKLKLLERNPRKITKDQMEKLCDRLLKDPGFLDKRPVLVNKQNGILQVYAGNQRVRAAKKIGWKSIPCDVDEDLDEDLMKERIIADNAHFGVNDYDILANDFDMDLLISCGYTLDQLGISPIMPIEEEESEDKEKKVKYCPHCNGEL